MYNQMSVKLDYMPDEYITNSIKDFNGTVIPFATICILISLCILYTYIALKNDKYRNFLIFLNKALIFVCFVLAFVFSLQISKYFDYGSYLLVLNFSAANMLYIPFTINKIMKIRENT